MKLKTITKIFILSVVFIASSLSYVFAETLYFGSQTQFSRNVDYKFFVRNYRKNKASETWKLSEEFQLPIDYSKNLGLLITREIKNPNERLTHLKKYCELNKRPSDACVNLQNGTDKNNYFYHINLGLAKYQTYPYTYSQQIPIQNKTFYTNK